MGALVAVLSKCEENIVPRVVAMLEELLHRGNQAHQVITPETSVSTKCFDELRKRSALFSSPLAIGHNVSSTSLVDRSGGFGNHHEMVFEGQIFTQSTTRSIGRAAFNKVHPPQHPLKKMLRTIDGYYAFAVFWSGQLMLGRDPLGVMPLYYGENEALCAIASERKALWKIELVDVHSFPPGNLASVNRQGFSFNAASTIRQPPQRGMKMREAASRLQKLLEKSTRERVAGAEDVGVAFSGGLDSTVIARLAQKCEVAVTLVTVGLKGQSELAHAEESAKALGLPIMIQAFTIADVEEVLPKVLWLIEEPNIMKAGLGIPLFWTAQVAARLGCRYLLAGQGADELFGGYRRYLTVYAKCGIKKVVEALYHDTTTSYEANFQRDEPLTVFNGVELRLPFADNSVVRFALSLPIDLKIESENDGLRKRVLRQVAENLGIPPFIVCKPKKAIQFATGVDRGVRDLARSKGLTPREYITQVFKAICPNLRGMQGEHSNLLQPKIS